MPARIARAGRPAAPAALQPADRADRAGAAAIVIEVGRPGLVVLIGAAGSGKTTLTGRLFAPDEVISSDELRAAVSGDAADQRATRPAFTILHREVARRLAAGRLVVVDATSVERSARLSLLRLAAATGALTTALVLALPDDVVQVRNAARPGRAVPRDVVAYHLARVAQLVADGDVVAVEALRTEGFAAVVLVHSDGELASLQIVRGPAVTPR
jgi:protein phosphatase